MIIDVNNLTKNYGKTRGIEDVTFSVPEGAIFGFLGPNGAGKTTTIRILLDLVRPSSGSVTLFGQPVQPHYPAALRRRIGYLSGELRMYEELTGYTYLQLMGKFYGGVDESNRSQLLATLELSQVDLKRPLRDYSHGMRQKIGIVQALQHEPDLLILDEPTEGLDPLIRTRFYEMLTDLAAHGHTILMSSHNLAEVERVCEQVAILREGRLLTTQRVNELKAVRLYQIQIEFATDKAAEAFDLAGAEMEETQGKLRILRWRGEFADLFGRLHNEDITDFTCRQADLEEIFLTFYQREDGDDQ